MIDTEQLQAKIDKYAGWIDTAVSTRDRQNAQLAAQSEVYSDAENRRRAEEIQQQFSQDLRDVAELVANSYRVQETTLDLQEAQIKAQAEKSQDFGKMAFLLAETQAKLAAAPSDPERSLSSVSALKDLYQKAVIDGDRAAQRVLRSVGAKIISDAKQSGNGSLSYAANELDRQFQADANAVDHPLQAQRDMLKPAYQQAHSVIKRAQMMEGDSYRAFMRGDAGSTLWTSELLDRIPSPNGSQPFGLDNAAANPVTFSEESGIPSVLSFGG